MPRIYMSSRMTYKYMDMYEIPKILAEAYMRS